MRFWPTVLPAHLEERTGTRHAVGGGGTDEPVAAPHEFTTARAMKRQTSLPHDPHAIVQSYYPRKRASSAIMIVSKASGAPWSTTVRSFARAGS